METRKRTQAEAEAERLRQELSTFEAMQSVLPTAFTSNDVTQSHEYPTNSQSVDQSTQDLALHSQHNNVRRSKDVTFDIDPIDTTQEQQLHIQV